MKTKSKKIALIIPVILLIAFFTIKFWAQEVCVEFRENFPDSFDTTDWKDHDNSSVYWPGAGFAGSGEITLNRLGANFAVAEPSGMGARIYVCDAGDFDGDGYPDIVGLEIFPGDPYSNRLLLCRNYFEDLDGDGIDDDGTVLYADFNEIYDTGFACGPASISVADYNGDGLLDFFFMKNRQDEFAYTEFVAAMFINVGTATDPDFVQYQTAPNLDFTSRFMSENIYINWAADHVASVDIDNDMDIDILVISEDKIYLVRNPGPTNFNISQFDISELNYDLPTGFTTGRGGSSVDAADFDHDGDVDIIGGSVMDIPFLVYYENDSQGNFTRHELPIPISEATGTVATCVADFNLDGYIDIFAGTDRWNAGNEAHMWFMKNTGGLAPGGEAEFDFRCLNNCNPILPDPHDVDMSALLDFDQDGDMDVILADANHSGNYYLIKNELADVYVLHGEAWSSNVTPLLDPATQAITRVRLMEFDQHVRGGSSQGLSVELYVSNNNGRDWEYVTRFDDDEITDLPSAEPWHYFTHFGSQLKWKAILTAREDDMDEFDGASFETPVLEYIRLRYAVVDRREYSRTSVAARVIDDSGENVKLIIGGTFYFPGWQGHLRAYDVTNMTATTTSDSVLRTITRPDLGDPTGRELVAAGVNIRWDAGRDLMDRAPSSRVIYTAMPDGAGGYDREDFTVANVGTLQGELNDFQNDNSGLIQFVRGEGRDWILGDINHSNPALAGPPAGDELKMGSGYDAYKTAWEDRPKVLFVGANAGMIHCFSVLTGEELWAFVPHNLISKLRNMWPVDPITGERYFDRDVYVDGSPVVADVYFDDNWHTILICGQGPGQGKAQGVDATGNYYFALDITNINDPQPMWEFTEARMGETWSTPVIGRILNDGVEMWTAFMGSGYDNVPSQGRQGHRFYAVDVEIGQAYWYFNANPEINTKTGVPDGVVWPNDENVLRSIPGSPNMVDTDGNGSADAVYVGDLEGRMWKVNVGIEYLASDPWDAELMYEDPNNYPIITKPEVWLDVVSPGTPPRIFFGTGGDDNAPAVVTYSFIALIDDATPEVEWFLGDPNILGLPVEKHVGDLTVGEKVWADPKEANKIIYFSTLTGNIESVDPCESLVGIGRLYGRFVKATAGTPVGGTAFREAGGQVENMQLAIKTRAAVTLGESQEVSGMQKREVYIQEYDSTIQRLEQAIGALLKIKSWREIYRIIK